MYKNSEKTGLTLVEIIVSILIVAFMLIGMLRLYSLGRIQSLISRHRIMAGNLAQAEIENLKNITYENIVLASYPLIQNVKIDTGETVAVNDDLNGTMLTQISSIDQGYKIIVTVSWNDYYGQINEILESTVISYL